MKRKLCPYVYDNTLVIFERNIDFNVDAAEKYLILKYQKGERKQYRINASLPRKNCSVGVKEIDRFFDSWKKEINDLIETTSESLKEKYNDCNIYSIEFDYQRNTVLFQLESFELLNERLNKALLTNSECIENLSFADSVSFDFFGQKYSFKSNKALNIDCLISKIENKPGVSVLNRLLILESKGLVTFNKD